MMNINRTCGFLARSFLSRHQAVAFRSVSSTGSSTSSALPSASPSAPSSRPRIEAEEPKPISQKSLLKRDLTLKVEDYFRVHDLFTVKDLFEARVHLGHKYSATNPGMKQFIYGTRFGISIIDLDQTAFHLRQALNFIAHIAFRGGIILFVSQQPQFVHMVERTAIECKEFVHCRAWAHTLFGSPHEAYGAEVRFPDLVIVVNSKVGIRYDEHGVIVDAAKAGIPTIAIMDTDCSPNIVTYPIPGNDDTIDSVALYLELFKQAILRGKEERRKESESD